MPPTRFCVLKIPFTKKKVEHSQNERVNQRYQEIKFVTKKRTLNFGPLQHCNVIVEIT